MQVEHALYIIYNRMRSWTMVAGACKHKTWEGYSLVRWWRDRGVWGTCGQGSVVWRYRMVRFGWCMVKRWRKVIHRDVWRLTVPLTFVSDGVEAGAGDYTKPEEQAGKYRSIQTPNTHNKREQGKILPAGPAQRFIRVRPTSKARI